MNAFNHYPTDVVIAIDRLQKGRDLQRYWVRHAASSLPLQTILNPQSLEAGLDQLLQGLLQYPWMPLPEGGLAYATPRPDRVLIEFDDDAATLRGLILAL